MGNGSYELLIFPSSGAQVDLGANVCTIIIALQLFGVTTDYKTVILRVGSTTPPTHNFFTRI